MPDPAALPIAQRIARSSENATSLASKMFEVKLDYSAASFSELDFIIDYFRKQIPKEFSGKEREDVYTGASLKWGAYFGETMRRLHGGNWIDRVPPVLMIRRLGTQPFLFVGASMTGKTMRVGKRDVAATVEYYASSSRSLAKQWESCFAGRSPTNRLWRQV